MKTSRPKSFSKLDKNTFNNIQYNFSRTSTNFYSPNNSKNSFNKSFRILSSSNNAFLPKFKEKLFSLLDVNYKVTNSRGTSLPIQYKRLSEEENKRQFGFLYREEQNHNLALIKNFLNNMQISKYKIKKEDKNKNNEKKLEIKIDNNNKEKDNNIPKKENTKKIIDKPNKKIKTKINEKSEKLKLKLKNRNDLWLPKGYPEYELLVENPKLLKKYIKNNIFANNLPEYTLSDVKKKSKESDIFFKKPITFKESLYNKKTSRNNYQSSDIFNLKYDLENLSKCSETYLFKDKNKNKNNYYITRESESKWSPKIPFLGFMNSPSTEYNILSPSKINIGYTRDKIVTEVEKNKSRNIEEKKLGEKISKSVNYMNPIYRQKGIGEFIDVTRNGGNNVGKDYLAFYHKNNKCFRKSNDVCATFYNSYNFYKDICQKPFTLNPTLKIN